jgi:hypothetical protein
LLQASYLTIRATTQPTSRWITLTASYYRALNNRREFFFSLLFIFLWFVMAPWRFLEYDEAQMIINCEENIVSIKCYFKKIDEL